MIRYSSSIALISSKIPIRFLSYLRLHRTRRKFLGKIEIMNPSEREAPPLTEEMVLRALSRWHDEDAETPLDHLLIFRQEQEQGADMRQAGNAVLQAGLKGMANGAPDLSAIIRDRFERGFAGYEIAASRHIAEGTVWRKQREGIGLLCRTLLDMEFTARAAQSRRFHGRLEAPTYTRLLGADKHLRTLASAISRPEAPWLIAVEGIGGIGKTALVDALTRQLLTSGHWQDFAWVTARRHLFNGGGAIREVDRAALTVDEFLDALIQQLIGSEFPLGALTSARKHAILKHRLTLYPHLVVVDNLETVPQVEALLTCLRGLAGPTKFLLTSRHSHNHAADIFHFVMPELCRADALALLRTEAANRNVDGVRNATDQELSPIYATVGGNPLALRLVVGQLQSQPLNAVLSGLRHAQGRSTTELYKFIYRQAWDEMDEDARRVFLMMPLLAEHGGDLAYLSAMAVRIGLSDGAMREGLSRLVERNLVDCLETQQTQRYTIHSLTRAFLQRQVLRWSGQCVCVE